MNKLGLRAKYTFALILIVVSILFFYITTFTLIKNHNQYAENINLVGKQRMLTAKIAYDVNHLSHHNTQKHNILLENAITEFETVESILQSRGYIFEEKNKKEYIEYVKHFLSTLDKFEIIHENEIANAIFEKQYEILINNIDNYVHMVQKESEKSTQDIINIQTILMLLFFILLAFEAFYIFLPTEKEIEAKTKELENINKNLQERISNEVNKNQKQAVQMIQQSRLAQMGEMVSMIAHQWRQPLSSISAISGTLTIDIMMDEYKADFFQQQLDSISELAQHLSCTIDDFRYFFKDNKERQEVKLNDIISGSLQIIGPTLETKNITIEIECSDEILVYTYVNEVKQVLLNILKNAEDILIEVKPEDATIFISGYKEDKYVCLSIKDNAGGISDAIMPKIFDPYFSTKTAKDGTGLGLYMSKTIIEEHCKGKLTVYNDYKGANFIISLPAE